MTNIRTSEYLGAAAPRGYCNNQHSGRISSCGKQSPNFRETHLFLVQKHNIFWSKLTPCFGQTIVFGQTPRAPQKATTAIYFDFAQCVYRTKLKNICSNLVFCCFWFDDLPDCDAPDAPANGAIKNVKNKYKLEAVVTFVCDPGFELKGKGTAKCDVDSDLYPIWTAKTPRCVRKYMKNYIPKGAKSTFSSFEKIRFICPTLYTCLWE